MSNRMSPCFTVYLGHTPYSAGGGGHEGGRRSALEWPDAADGSWCPAPGCAHHSAVLGPPALPPIHAHCRQWRPGPPGPRGPGPAPEGQVAAWWWVPRPSLGQPAGGGAALDALISAPRANEQQCWAARWRHRRAAAPAVGSRLGSAGDRCEGRCRTWRSRRVAACGGRGAGRDAFEGEIVARSAALRGDAAAAAPRGGRAGSWHCTLLCSTWQDSVDYEGLLHSVGVMRQQALAGGRGVPRGCARDCTLNEQARRQQRTHHLQTGLVVCPSTWFTPNLTEPGARSHNPSSRLLAGSCQAPGRLQDAP